MLLRRDILLGFEILLLYHCQFVLSQGCTDAPWCTANMEFWCLVNTYVRETCPSICDNRCNSGVGSTPTWGDWGSYGDCSAPCDGGKQTRERECSIVGLCPGLATETRNCNEQPCDDSEPPCPKGFYWTKYYDRDNPSGTGDYETLEHLRREHPHDNICAKPYNVQARLVSNKAPWKTAGENKIQIDKDIGFVCRKKDQSNNRCHDYEVRFCCPGVPTNITRCSGSGDPHYTTFDKKKFDFQGDCSYTFARYSGSDHEEFDIEVFNIHRGGRISVSWLDRAVVRMYDDVINLNTNLQIKVNGEVVNLPYTSPSKYTIEKQGRFAVLKAANGLEVKVDGIHSIVVSVPSDYSGGKLEGLCGNFDGNPSNDIVVDGKEDPNAHGNRYLTPSKTECMPAEDLKENECSKPTNTQRYRHHCAVITDTNGPFKSCHAIIKPDNNFSDCTFDVCVYRGGKSALEQAIAAYAQACNEEGVRIEPWRDVAGTPLTCPLNSEYSSCASLCPRTCVNTSPSCGEGCVEGCECSEGYILSGDHCVKTAECGCSFEGKYYLAGESFLQESCSKRCTCRFQRMSCVDTRCGKSETCGTDDKGRQACQQAVLTNMTKCSGGGDPHYSTFDKKRFDFQGDCSYTFARYSGSEHEEFDIEVFNEHRGGKISVSWLDRAVVKMHGDVINLNPNLQMKVNGEVVNLPYTSLSKYIIERQGRFAVLKATNRLEVKVDGKYSIVVSVPPQYFGDKLEGLCGNFDGNSENDIVVDGVEDPNAHGNRYLTPSKTKCVPAEDLKENECSKSGNTQRYRHDCAVITNRNGPFKSCHKSVKPDNYFDDCIFDVCVYGGEKSALEHAVAAYAQACNEEGVRIEPWRDVTGTPLTCPPYSEYSSCISLCPMTCVNTSPACGEGCVEGCKCNEGYILSGDRCVRTAECGCTFEGKYYLAAESFLQDLCSQRCTCRNQRMTCVNTQCGQHETCGTDDKGRPACQPASTGHWGCSDVRTDCQLRKNVGHCPWYRTTCQKTCEYCTTGNGGNTPTPTWNRWSGWRACSKKCDGGSQSRWRTCSQSGRCPGSSTQSRSCNQQACVVAGCSDVWTNCELREKLLQCRYSSVQRNCQKTCRQCDAGNGGGTPTPTPTWNRWSGWGACSKKCDGGSQSRSRTCSQPGRCSGTSTESRSCNQQACVVEGCSDVWTNCELREKLMQCRYSSVQKNCQKTCRQCDTGSGVGEWGQWGDYDECTKTCDRGTKSRTRTCSIPGTCPGDDRETITCEIQPCEADWDTWAQWTVCDKPCGTGQQSRTRTCPVSERCVGDSQQSRECNKDLCQTSAWSDCSVTCGHGIEKRLIASTGLYETRPCKADKDCATVSCPNGQERRFKNPSQCCVKTSPFGNWCDRPAARSYEYSRRIIGGDDSIRGDFPWMALFNALDYCGGVVISKKYILTAAHCVQSDDGRKVDQFTVDLGFADIRNNFNKQKASVIKSIVYPGYQFPKHDIAILQLKDDLVYSNYVRPICLPHGEEVPYDSTCIAMGWGISINGVRQLTNILQNVDVKVFDPDVCIHGYSNANQQYLANFLKTKPGVLCAGDLFDEKDSCSGDSGGPLACQRCNTCGWFVAGVVSFGPTPCAYKGIPGVYTSVVAYENWIYSVTGETRQSRGC